MRKIQNLKHTRDTYYFAFARMLERASFYGARALLVLYMIGETIKMERTEALSIYGWLTGSLVLTQIIGGLFGDLIIGNKKSIIVGGILQAIGVFSLCIPTVTGLYIGLTLFILGSGFFTPNILSCFGKLYLNKTKLLDSGFTLLILFVNLGSFIGILIISYLGEKYGDNIGFLLSGILILLSLITILSIKENTSFEIDENEVVLTSRVLNILIAFIAVGMFWGIYDISNSRVFDLQTKFNDLQILDMPTHLWHSGNLILLLIVSLIAVILWKYFYSSSFLKLILGFTFGAISFGTLLLIPEVPAKQHLTAFLISLLFLGISEVHIAPIIYSIITKYSNPKYLAIIMSLSFLPTRIFASAFGLFNDSFYENPTVGLKFGLVAMTVLGLSILMYIKWNKKAIRSAL